MRRWIAPVLLALLALTGCTAQPSSVTGAARTPSREPTSTASVGTTLSAAEATVLAYYQAIAAHDAAAARTYLAPEYYKGFASPAAYQAWIANYLHLTRLTLHSERPAGPDTAAQHRGYRDLTEVLVSYHAVLRTPSANETTGSMDRFAVVGRAGPASPWVIVDMATSP
jgi:hypothetical protein